MAAFPLYNQIYCKVKNNDTTLSEDDKSFFVDTVKTLSATEHEIIFALIRTFQIRNSDAPFYNILPYHSKHQKKGIKFDFDKLPQKLQQVLFYFTKIHLRENTNH